VSQQLSKPCTEDWVAVKRILRYLKATPDMGIHYSRSDPQVLEGYVDADWAGDSADRKSTSGWVFTYGGGPVSWASKKQQCVALSSTEAEYIAASQATQEAVWLRGLLDSLSVEPVGPTRLFEDNQGCIAMTRNPVGHKRTKHVDIRYHFIREKVEQGQIILQYCPTAEMIADIFTKPLAGEKFSYLRDKLGVRRVGVLTEGVCGK
jgi:hypothetical protein